MVRCRVREENMKRLPFRDLRAGSHGSGWERTRWRNHSHKLWPPKSGAKQLRAKQMTSSCRRIRYELASRHRPFPEVAVANVPMRVIASLHQTKGEQLLHNTTLPAAHNRCTAMCRLIEHALAPCGSCRLLAFGGARGMPMLGVAAAHLPATSITIAMRRCIVVTPVR